MVGLSIALESSKVANHEAIHPQVTNKATMMIKPSPSPNSPPSTSPQPSHRATPQWISPSPVTAASFLDQCFLCKQKLLPGRDIYMYKGDRAFCSEECRCRQIFMDDVCSLAAMKPQSTSTSSRSPSSSSPRNRRGARN